MQVSRREYSELIECWRKLPVDSGCVPKKSSFSPIMIKRLLPYIFILGSSDEGLYDIRLLGTEIETALGGVDKGKKLVQEFVDGKSKLYRNFIKRCERDPVAGYLRHKLHKDDDSYVEVETMIVPLADEGGNPHYLLGVASLSKGYSQRYSTESVAAETVVEYASLSDVSLRNVIDQIETPEKSEQVENTRT